MKTKDPVKKSEVTIALWIIKISRQAPKELK